MHIDIPDNVKLIIERLYDNGYEAYAVGGCVRDSFLGKVPKDWDITTSASPYEVKEIFKKTIDTGIKHGTVTVMINHEGYEVTTYRIDGEYRDSRHPEEVFFTSNLEKDLKRRDFTINAMAYNEQVGLIDCFDGAKDLKNGVIRCVGEATERFSEDSLRILRAVRFAAQLGFYIEDKTVSAIRDKVNGLKNISAERIKVEVDKILLSDNADRLIWAYNYGITNIILPEFDVMMRTLQDNPNHIYSVGVHTVKALENIKEIINIKINQGMIIDERDRLMLCWTMLMHDIAKPVVKKFDEQGVAHFKCHEIVGVDMAKEVYKRLKFDRYTQDYSLNLIKFHDYRTNNSKRSLRKGISKIGADMMPYLFIVKEADIKAQNPEMFNEKLQHLSEMQRLCEEIIEESDCLTLKDLDIDGKEIIKLGIAEGKTIGKVLSYLLDKVLEEPDLNKKEILIQLATEYKNKN